MEFNYIKCACGCGQSFIRYDKQGRNRIYISGHNARKYKTFDKVPSKEANKRWKIKNPDKIRETKKARYRMLKLKAMNLLGNNCHFCNIEYNGKNSPIFEFHHFDPSTKENGITRMLINKAWSAVLSELEKCYLVCANCHNQHHGGEW